MYTHIYTHMYTHIYIYVYSYVYVYIYSYTHTYTPTPLQSLTCQHRHLMVKWSYTAALLCPQRCDFYLYRLCFQPIYHKNYCTMFRYVT